MKYRKTALVDAEQFLPAEGKIPAGVRSSGFSDPGKSPEEWVLDTLEGQHTLRNGDYICTGPGGERWNVEQSIFEATYEPALSPASPARTPMGGRPSDEQVRRAIQTRLHLHPTDETLGCLDRAVADIQALFAPPSVQPVEVK